MADTPLWPARLVNRSVVVPSLMLFAIIGPSLAQDSRPENQLTDDHIRERMIQQSIAQYRGNCPCPYNQASNGSRCGNRSAYRRPGGQSPLCYREDISEDMVRRYRTQLK